MVGDVKGKKKTKQLLGSTNFEEIQREAKNPCHVTVSHRYRNGYNEEDVCWNACWKEWESSNSKSREDCDMSWLVYGCYCWCSEEEEEEGCAGGWWLRTQNDDGTWT